jgi:hypothetical protein
MRVIVAEEFGRIPEFEDRGYSQSKGVGWTYSGASDRSRRNAT